MENDYFAEIIYVTGSWFPPDDQPHQIPEEHRLKLTVTDFTKPVGYIGGGLALGYLTLVHPQLIDWCRYEFAPWTQPCEDAAELGRGLGSTATTSASMIPSELAIHSSATGAPTAFGSEVRSGTLIIGKISPSRVAIVNFGDTSKA